MQARQRPPAVVERRARPAAGRVAGLAGLREVGRDVVRRGRVLVVGHVAADAVRRRALVGASGVAARAGHARVQPGERVARVVERRRHPGRVAVAHRAVGRTRAEFLVRGIVEHVARLDRGSGPVAAAAGLRQVRPVVPVQVAGGARDGRREVRAGEREVLRVVQRSRLPGVRRVAVLAGLREVERRVRRAVRRAVVAAVAAVAGRRGDGRVDVVQVAVRADARRHRVLSGQRPPAAVIEGRARPVGRAVAHLAGLREVRRHVVGVRRALVVRQVAADTGRRRAREDPVRVAVGALPRRDGVGSGERPPAVVEGRTRPAGRRVAGLAGLRELRRDVVRRGRAVVVGKVAADAGRGRVVVHAVQVTGRAGGAGVHAGQRPHAVREVRAFPADRVVAVLAGRLEVARRVRRVRRRLVVRQVAAHAGGRRVGVAPAQVAVHAQRREEVRAGERETRVVEGRRQPGRGGVAVGAGRPVRAELLVRHVARRVDRVDRRARAVAAHAGVRRRQEVSARVAIGAGARRHRVPVGERERGGVVERRGHEAGSAVALLAGRRQARDHVVRRRRLVVVRLVAADAHDRRRAVVRGGVAGRAVLLAVHPGQGPDVVVEDRGVEVDRVVAVGAARRVAGRGVVGRGGRVELREVAADAGVRRAQEDVGLVAIRAGARPTVWLPTSGQLEWLNCAPRQPNDVWQSAQVCWIAAAACAGLVVES